jgi:DNA polymerase-3 subunit beta
MKLHCHRPSLVTAFQVVSGVVPSRTPKEILKNVKLEVRGGQAVLIGTDQEVGIRYTIPGVEIESDGEVLLPANRVKSILHELTDDGVNLEVKDDAAWIRAGQSEFRLSACDAVEFPPVTEFDSERFHVVTGKILGEAIRRTVFATDVESTRYALGGVLVEFEPEAMTLAATDSRRLAVVKCACRSEGKGDSTVLKPVVPSKAMTLIQSSIVADDEDVQISVHENDVVVRCGNAVISARLVEGRFPNYTEVIPKEAAARVEMVVGPFLAVVRQAQIVTDEESRGVDFTFSKGSLTLKSCAAKIGESKVELPVSYDGDELTITFDPRFVADFLRVLEPGEQLSFELIDAERAAVLRTDDAYTYVIMPLSRDR